MEGGRLKYSVTLDVGPPRLVPVKATENPPEESPEEGNKKPVSAGPKYDSSPVCTGLDWPPTDTTTRGFCVQGVGGGGGTGERDTRDTTVKKSWHCASGS